MDDLFADAEVISGYTRAQAIADGVLVDAGELAREAGFKFPVAFTAAAWQDAVAWPKENAAYQDEVGRLWDVLNMARLAALRARHTKDNAGGRVPFMVYRVPNTPTALEPEEVQLVVVVGPGDRGEGVLTIMEPNED